VDADDTCMLMLELADGTLARFVSVLVPSRGEALIEVYGDRGTLVLVTIRKITFMVFGSGQHQREPMAELQFNHLFSSNLPDGRIAPFIRVIDSWVQGIARGEMTPSPEEVYSQLLMDLTHESDATGCWWMCRV